MSATASATTADRPAADAVVAAPSQPRVSRFDLTIADGGVRPCSPTSTCSAPSSGPRPRYEELDPVLEGAKREDTVETRLDDRIVAQPDGLNLTAAATEGPPRGDRPRWQAHREHRSALRATSVRARRGAATAALGFEP